MDPKQEKYEQLEKQHKIWLRSPIPRNSHLYNRLIRGLVNGDYEDNLNQRGDFTNMALNIVHKVYKNPHSQHAYILRDFMKKFTDLILKDYARIKENDSLWLDPPLNPESSGEIFFFEELDRRRERIFTKLDSGEITVNMPIDLLSEIYVLSGKYPIKTSNSTEYRTARLLANKWLGQNKDRCLFEMFGIKDSGVKVTRKRQRGSLGNDSYTSDYEPDSESSSKPNGYTFPARKKMKLKHSPIQKNSTEGSKSFPNPSSDESSSTDDISRSSSTGIMNAADRDAFTKPNLNLRSKSAISRRQNGNNWLSELQKLQIHTKDSNEKDTNMIELRMKRVQEVLESEILPDVAMCCLIKHYYQLKDDKYRRSFKLLPFNASFDYLRNFKNHSRSKSSGDDLTFYCISQNGDFYGIILRRSRNKRIFDEKVVVLNSCKESGNQNLVRIIQELQVHIPEIEYYSELDYPREFPKPISRDYLVYFFKWLTMESLEKLFDDEPCDMPCALTGENLENFRKEYAIVIYNSIPSDSLEIPNQF